MRRSASSGAEREATAGKATPMKRLKIVLNNMKLSMLRFVLFCCCY
jgi:hypothetical protein